MPEWKLRSVRPMRKSDGMGHGFFLQQRSVTSLLADACTWCGKELRTYMIVGPPGTGKTELTVWLAGYLRCRSTGSPLMTTGSPTKSSPK